jgi:uncharacterized membrane protein
MAGALSAYRAAMVWKLIRRQREDTAELLAAVREMKLTSSEVWFRLRGTYWFVPLVITVGCAAAAMGAVLLQPALPGATGRWLAFLYPGTVEGAHALLASVTSSIITVVSVTFSITVLALTVAAQHFGPRLMDTFMRDEGSKTVLGIFIGTFVYCVLLMSVVDGREPGATVPAAALSGAVLLVVASVGALIYFVHHVAASLQVTEIAERLGRDLEREVLTVYGPGPAGPAAEAPPGTPADAAAVPALVDGYIQRIDEEGLVALAQAAGCTMWIRRGAGDFVIAGTTLVDVSPAPAPDGEFTERVNALFVVGVDRTAWQDPEFTVSKLVEVALRALSPAVNEPFTALTCIDRLGQGLARAAAHPSPGLVRRDAGGAIRLVLRRERFPALLGAAFDQIRIFAGPNPEIYVRLLDTLGMLSEVTTDPGHLAALSAQAAAVAERARQEVAAPDLAPVERHVRTPRRANGQSAVSAAAAATNAKPESEVSAPASETRSAAPGHVPAPADSRGAVSNGAA